MSEILAHVLGFVDGNRRYTPHVDSSTSEGKSVGRLVTACGVLAAAAAFAALQGMQSCWPPEFFGEWTLTWLLGGASLACGLAASALSRGKKPRIEAGLAMGIASFAYLTPCVFYNRTWHNLPWPAILVWAIGLGIAGWPCRQKLLAILAPLTLWACVGPGLAAPKSLSPVALSNGDLAMTVSWRPGGNNLSQGLILDMKRRSGRPLGDAYDVRNVAVESSAGPIEIGTWPPHRISFEDGPTAPTEVQLIATTFVPDWVRSWDVRLVVPRWPQRPLGHVRVTVPHEGDPPSGGSDPSCQRGMRVQGLRWSTSTGRLPEERCLVLNVESDIFDGGLGRDTWRSLRIRDNRGRVLAFTFLEYPTGRAALQVVPVAPDTQYVDVDLFSEAQRRAFDLEFRISRLSAAR